VRNSLLVKDKVIAMKADVVILGAGSAGEMMAPLLTAAGKTVIIVEKFLIGGQCPFYSCMPSKSMLRSALSRFEAGRTYENGGTSRPVDLGSNQEAYARAADRRNEITEHGDDKNKEKSLLDSGVKIIRGNGSITAPNVVTVNGQDIEFIDLVISTGSLPKIPAIKGLSEIEYWGSEEATTINELPQSLTIIGGGPVGCELAQMFSRFGSEVTLIEPQERLIGHEEPEVSAELRRIFELEDIQVITGNEILQVNRNESGRFLIELESGARVESEKLLIATGRSPSTKDIGLEILGIKVGKEDQILTESNLQVKGREHIWAVGDVTGVGPFTHTANYQGRIAVHAILGKMVAANYSALPRAVYTDPSVCSVGIGFDAALKKGIDAIKAINSLTNVSRSETDGNDGGVLVLVADKKSQLLIGASAIGMHAEEWLSEAFLSIRAQVPLAVLADVVHPFPSYGEVMEAALRELLAQCEQASPA
jgi:pyruvate/2-oxoglutarate dehydrogenase complex dihydrolipoamide dehydrogenase (E3) component